jgi:hypothetical protein
VDLVGVDGGSGGTVATLEGSLELLVLLLKDKGERDEGYEERGERILKDPIDRESSQQGGSVRQSRNICKKGNFRIGQGKRQRRGVRARGMSRHNS